MYWVYRAIGGLRLSGNTEIIRGVGHCLLESMLCRCASWPKRGVFLLSLAKDATFKRRLRSKDRRPELFRFPSWWKRRLPWICCPVCADVYLVLAEKGLWTVLEMERESGDDVWRKMNFWQLSERWKVPISFDSWVVLFFSRGQEHFIVYATFLTELWSAVKTLKSDYFSFDSFLFVNEGRIEDISSSAKCFSFIIHCVIVLTLLFNVLRVLIMRFGVWEFQMSTL